jgi:hypothetical protein
MARVSGGFSNGSEIGTEANQVNEGGTRDKKSSFHLRSSVQNPQIPRQKRKAKNRISGNETALKRIFED